MKDTSLARRRIVVSGSASGIGAALASELRAAGATVVGLDLHDAEVIADLADPDAIDAAAAVIGRAGPVHGLVNVAGRHPRQGNGNEIVTVNLLGTRQLTERLVDRMASGSSVVVIGSSAGWAWRDRTEDLDALLDTTSFAEGVARLAAHPVPDADGYARSKELLARWTRRAAVAWRERGIRVNLVAPGPVATAAFLAFRERLGNPPLDDVDRVGRAGSVAEVTAGVAFLMSDAAAWINGVELPVDGGLVASYAIDPPGGPSV
jgi:NAD(P)-dependent dehydrogenase (short-subunit alcohol dehydrogenase family)